MSFYEGVFKVGGAILGGTVTAGCYGVGQIRRVTAADAEEGARLAEAWNEAGKKAYEGARDLGGGIGKGISAVQNKVGKYSAAAGYHVAEAVGADPETVRKVEKVCGVLGKMAFSVLGGDILGGGAGALLGVFSEPIEALTATGGLDVVPTGGFDAVPVDGLDTVPAAEFDALPAADGMETIEPSTGGLAPTADALPKPASSSSPLTTHAEAVTKTMFAAGAGIDDALRIDSGRPEDPGGDER